MRTVGSPRPFVTSVSLPNLARLRGVKRHTFSPVHVEWIWHNDVKDFGAVPPLPTALECWTGSAWKAPESVFGRGPHSFILDYGIEIWPSDPYRVVGDIATRWFKPSAQVIYPKTGLLTGFIDGPPI